MELKSENTVKTENNKTENKLGTVSKEKVKKPVSDTKDSIKKSSAVPLVKEEKQAIILKDVEKIKKVINPKTEMIIEQAEESKKNTSKLIKRKNAEKSLLTTKNQQTFKMDKITQSPDKIKQATKTKNQCPQNTELKESDKEDVSEVKNNGKKMGKKLKKNVLKRRTRLAPNTRSINTAGVSSSVAKKVKKIKHVIVKEQKPSSDTEEEEIKVEPISKKIKLGVKEETLKINSGKQMKEKRKLDNKVVNKEGEEPATKHIKVDEEISFDISMLTPKAQKKKSLKNVSPECKKEQKVVKKDGNSLKTKTTTEKNKKKIRKDLIEWSGVE